MVVFRQGLPSGSVSAGWPAKSWRTERARLALEIHVTYLGVNAEACVAGGRE
jgi:hypothetical protein